MSFTGMVYCICERRYFTGVWC